MFKTIIKACAGVAHDFKEVTLQVLSLYVHPLVSEIVEISRPIMATCVSRRNVGLATLYLMDDSVKASCPPSWMII